MALLIILVFDIDKCYSIISRVTYLISLNVFQKWYMEKTAKFWPKLVIDKFNILDHTEKSL
jgi:hypothetical protein